MQRYNILQAIFMSFYSKDLYRDVAKNWNGKTFVYLLFLVALSWVAFTIKMQLGLNEVYQKDTDKVVTQIPVLTIKDGKITTPENRPYFIKNPDTNETIAIIDTSGTYKTLSDAKTGILVTPSEVITQPNANETKINHVPNNLNLTINPTTINGYIHAMLPFAWIFLFIFFTFASFIYRIIQALIYAIIGKIICAIVFAPLRYSELLQIAVVAVTPAIVLSAVLDFWIVKFPHHLLLYFILAMIYLTFGILANKQPRENQSSTATNK